MVEVGSSVTFKTVAGRGRPRSGKVTAIDGDSVTIVDRLERDFTVASDLVKVAEAVC